MINEMASEKAAMHRLDGALTWQGFRELLPISLFVVFGATFGLEATQAGLSNASIIIMSALVFAGAAVIFNNCCD